MAAAAFLAGITAQQRRDAFGKQKRKESSRSSRGRMMPNPGNPTRRRKSYYLFARLMPRHVLSVAFIIQWSPMAPAAPSSKRQSHKENAT